MRLSNRNKIGYYNFLYSALMMLLALGIILFFAERYRLDFLGVESYLLIIVPLLIILIYYFRGRQIFEYDSDGEALNFKNRNIIPILNQPANDEFPKYKLLKYEVLNGIFFKRLYITISSKKGHPIILKYDISYLTRKEISDLKYSLSKVIKENKEKFA